MIILFVKTVKKLNAKQMKNIKQSRPFTFYLLSAALLFQGLSGAAGGLLLIIDPTGNLINMPLRWLSGSPFANYLMPGLFLFSMLGVFPLIVFFGLLIRHKHSWLASLFIGSTLILWIFIEIIIIGFQIQPPLQIIYGSLGILIIALSLRPSLRAFLNRSRTYPDQERNAMKKSGMGISL